MELKIYKPLDIDEAKLILEESGESFLVFNDRNSNLRVLVKINNQKYGIY